MSDLAILEPVDYLVIGHVAHDLTPEGPRLGGTAAYSALTAWAGTTCRYRNSLRTRDISCGSGRYPHHFHRSLQTAQSSKTFIRSRDGFNTCAGKPHASISTWFRKYGGVRPIIHLGPIANEMDNGTARNVFPRPCWSHATGLDASVGLGRPRVAGNGRMQTLRWRAQMPW